MAAVQNRFLQPHQPAAPLRKRLGACWGGLSCFRKQKNGKRIVPATRVPEANALLNQPNGPQAGGLTNQNTGMSLSLLAPPSSPASFSNSAIPSTTQSPRCFLSASSPEGPSSTMFVTGPYAYETQLVSPPVFSTFTTEPSTAPFTPPPELAHLTTPSSPDVPYAHFLSSFAKIKSSDKSSYIAANDIQTTYPLYPGSPPSTLRSSHVSRKSGDRLSSSFNEREFPPQWDPSAPSQDTKSDSGRFLGLHTDGVSKSRRDSNFFCPETFAQFYLDQSSLSNSGGRLSISKESDVCTNGGYGYQNRQIKTSKPDAEELEAYRASFGFSADEIITTSNYVEISDVLEDSFSITPFTSGKSVVEEHIFSNRSGLEGAETKKTQEELSSLKLSKAGQNHIKNLHSGLPVSYNGLEDKVPQQRLEEADQCLNGNNLLRNDDDDIF